MSNSSVPKKASSLAITGTQYCKACRQRLLRGKLKCHFCGAWNTPVSATTVKNGVVDDGTVLLHEVDDTIVKRLLSGPWDKNFANPPGLPDDSVTLIGGEPGAGKSTLALMLTDAIARSSRVEALYLCAEEGKHQIKARNVRLGLSSKLVRIVPLDRMADASLDTILTNRRFSCVVLDSIAGFTNDLDRAVEIAKAFKDYGDQYRTPFILINHITKDGDMAGSMKLQHAGDISLMLTKSGRDDVVTVRFGSDDEDLDDDDDEWFNVKELRTLYTDKSRYGPSGIETHFAMTERGLLQVQIKEDDDEDGEE